MTVSRPSAGSAVLVQPPPGDLTGPYPALPYLKAHAERSGHSVHVVDAGIEAFLFFTQPDRFHECLNRAAARRRELEARATITAVEQKEYARLASLVPMEREPDTVAEALLRLRDRNKFYDQWMYRQSSKALDAVFKLLSAVHYPTVVSPSEYPTAQELNSFDAVMAHRDGALNPYVAFYNEVLFPRLDTLEPGVIGISMEFASQSVQALVLGRLLKDRYPHVHITMGGAYLSQWVLLMGPDQFDWLFRCTDSVVCGEGEEAFTRLLDCVASQGDLAQVPNLLYRQTGSAEIERFDHLEYPDLSELPPPDFTDLDMSRYLIPVPVIPYAISRGCYWGKCVFCQNRYGESRMRRYQTVPVEKALSEMADLADRYGTSHFNFSNDVIDPAYLKRFSNAAISSGKKFVWNTDLRAETSITRDLCKLAAKAGLNSVAIGFESACQRTLDSMNKGKKVDQVRRVMKDLYDHGVAVQAMSMFGFPGETEQEAELTVRFLEENVDRISYYVVGLLMVVPGSRLYEAPEEYGVTSISYEGNTLMAPLPVWRSDKRISGHAVNRLYERLSRLEDVFAISEYPYAGALSTNHGFLYFRKGPDILKRMKKAGRDRVARLGTALATPDRKARNRLFKSLAPRLGSYTGIFQSPFPLDAEFAERSAGGQSSVPRRDPEHYLVSPATLPIPLEMRGLRLIQSMSGQKNLAMILGKVPESEHGMVLQLLLNLVHSELVAV